MNNKNRISVLRHEVGLNQKELAQKMSVTQSTISAWETGRSNPTPDQLGQMADIFRCSIDYLLGKGKVTAGKGLTQEQIIGYMEQDRLAREQEQEYQEYLDGIGETKQAEEDERAYEELERSKFMSMNLPIFYEAYQFNEILEDLTQEQRKCLMDIVFSYNRALASTKNPTT